MTTEAKAREYAETTIEQIAFTAGAEWMAGEKDKEIDKLQEALKEATESRRIDNVNEWIPHR